MKATTLLSAVTALAITASAQQYRVELQRDVLSQQPIATLSQPAAGDIDGDGLLDLVFFGPRIFRSRGNHYEETETGLPQALPDLGAPTLIDVDGDGDLDMVHRTTSATSLRLLLNDGTGAFTDVTEGRLPSVWTFGSPTAADVDSDGDSDLLLPSGVLLINNGHGVFTDETATRITTTGGSIGDAALVEDFDRDGDLDFVIMTGLHRNEGHGFFQQDDDQTLAFSYGETPFSSDIDADGDVDVLTIAGRFLRNDGGVFEEQPNLIPASLANGWALATVIDVDGDGAEDLIVTPKWAITGERPAWVRNQGNGTFQWSMVNPPLNYLPVQALRIGTPLVADLDADGDQDLVTTVMFSQRPEVAEVLYNDGAGNWHNATDGGGMVPPRSYGRRAIDVNNDGFDDVVSELSWHENDGTGSFTQRHFASPLNGPTLAAAFADVNGDGSPDMLDRQAIWLNDGTGHYVLGTQLLTGTDWVRSAVAIDLDGDGDQDFAAAAAPYAVASTLRFFINDGTGQFTAVSPTQHGVNVSQPITLASADFDGDGDPDLAIGVNGFFFFGGEPVLLFANDGAGNFSPRPMPQTQWVVSNLHVADFEGDGDLDFITSSSNLPTLYVNDGNGGFADLSVSSDIGNRILLDDTDNDGDIDLWSYGYVSGWIQLFINDGSNTFVAAPERVDPSRPGNYPAMDLVLVDLEGDGDRDAIVFAENVHTSTQMAVPLWNHHRHLRVPYITKVGATLDLYVSSTAPQFAPALAFVAVSTTAAKVPLGSLGLLGVDPSASTVFPTTIPPATETQLLQVAVPAQPSLHGQSIFAQALFAINGELRLSGTVERQILN